MYLSELLPTTNGFTKTKLTTEENIFISNLAYLIVCFYVCGCIIKRQFHKIYIFNSNDFVKMLIKYLKSSSSKNARVYN